jgi:hypothetical protein
MNQGAKRSALSERGNDLYEIPACAIRTLMRVETLPRVISGAPRSLGSSLSQPPREDRPIELRRMSWRS